MERQIKLVLAQLNLMVGDIDGNTRQVLEAARLALTEHNAELIVFPELTLTGYPPEDLLLRPALEERVNKALDSILAANLDITMVLGLPEKCGGELYNALTVIRGNERHGTYYKQCLPNYQVFDEERYFDAGDGPLVCPINGIPVAFTICEDLWQQHPSQQACDAGAELLININASPYHMDKVAERRELLRQRSQLGQFPIVYVNLVGGQDELVFDGASMVVDCKGECVFQADSFVAGLYPVNIDLGVRGDTGKECVVTPSRVIGDTSLEDDVYQALVLGVRDYVEKNGFPSVVLGLSGGIDSALTLAVAVDALGPERVKAVMMPFSYTSELSLEVAAEQARALGVEYKVISIEKIYEAFVEELSEEFRGLDIDVAEQNIQARCRGVLLMAISNKKGSLVLTTGNKSEIAVGYSTLYGDMAGGFDVLKDVSKTLVYKLATYRNQSAGREIIPQRVIDRAPSAELAPGQVDQDSLPPYDDLDRILELYVENDASAADIIAEGYSEADVMRVLRLVDLNEYKRRQSPVGVRLTRRGFGRDRRYPITNGWPIGE